MTLRPYQTFTVKTVWEWIANNSGNLAVVMPTGSGKSLVLAQICKEALEWPGTRILMLTHIHELIRQDLEKLLHIWPNAPVGVYSAGLKSKVIDKITFAGIQSIREKAHLLGKISLVIVDEAHLISHNDEGAYRDLIKELIVVNPELRVVGLTASPYRLGHGLITEKPAIFDDMIEPVSIEQLQALGYLSRLRSKITEAKLDTEGVHKRGGDFIESELQAHVDTEKNNRGVVAEIVKRSEGRKSWLIFCAGVDHAGHVRDEFRTRGIDTEMVTGETPLDERADILKRFKNGSLQAVTNCNVLSTGFDAPNIDLIAMLRPTASPGLYLQQVGRGFRIKEHTDHCLILDFSGNVERHGPITGIRIPSKETPGDGIPPAKSCANCGEIVATSTKICPSCDMPFPEKEEPELYLRNDDIMGGPIELKVESWTWHLGESKTSKLPMIIVSYYGALGEHPIREYLCLWHDGFAGQKAHRRLKELADGAGVPMDALDGDWASDRMEKALPPDVVTYRMEGKFPRIITTRWDIPF